MVWKYSRDKVGKEDYKPFNLEKRSINNVLIENPNYIEKEFLYKTLLSITFEKYFKYNDV